MVKEMNIRLLIEGNNIAIVENGKGFSNGMSSLMEQTGILENIKQKKLNKIESFFHKDLSGMVSKEDD